MKRILILDDSMERITLFQSRLKDWGEVSYSTTGEECISILQNENFDYIFLDHDLGEGISGYDVAKWIAENYKGNATFILHSTNPAGVSNMKNALKNFNVLVIPFHRIWDSFYL